MAIAGIAAATSRGLSVPEDLSVVGFDDIPLAEYIAPPLSTVRQDVIAWGRAAAQQLVSLTQGHPFQAPALPPVEFVARASTAPCGALNRRTHRPRLGGGPRRRSAATAVAGRDVTNADSGLLRAGAVRPVRLLVRGAPAGRVGALAGLSGWAQGPLAAGGFPGEQETGRRKSARQRGPWRHRRPPQHRLHPNSHRAATVDVRGAEPVTVYGSLQTGLETWANIPQP